MKSSILIVLAIGFAGFGALEVAALNPSDALPSDNVEDAMTPKDAPEAAEISPSPIPGQTLNAVDTGSCLTPELVAAFEPRHLELESREAELDRREAELSNLKGALETRLSDMDATRTALEDMTQRLDVVAGEDISHLVQMYSTMKPKKAAAIFDRMDPAFAAGFLREIDSARAGIIMAEMSEEQSYRISLMIANRHAEWRNR